MSQEEKIPTGIYYVIPAQVLDDERLDHSEIIFYALLSGLAFSCGHCFASDEYLAKRMKYTDRKIRYMLEKLSGLGYIKRITIKIGMNWDRKIFICHSRLDSKDVYERNPRSGSSGTPVPDRAEPPFRIVSEGNIESKNIPPTPKGESLCEVFSFGKFVKLTKAEHEATVNLCGSVDAASAVISEINDYLSATGRKPYKDYAAAIRNWVRRKRTSSTPPLSALALQKRAESAQKFANRVKDMFPRHHDIRIEKTGIEFVVGASGSKFIPYTEFGFDEQVRNQLRKWGLLLGDL